MCVASVASNACSAVPVEQVASEQLMTDLGESIGGGRACGDECPLLWTRRRLDGTHGRAMFTERNIPGPWAREKTTERACQKCLAYKPGTRVHVFLHRPLNEGAARRIGDDAEGAKAATLKQDLALME